MVKLLKKISALLLPVLALSLITAAPANAATCSYYVLTYPAWYNGLEGCTNAQGSTKTDAPVVEDINDIWVLALNAVQWVIITAGYVALAFIIAGGFKYITAQGDPGRITSAKGSLVSAVVGLVVALAATVIVRTVQGVINGSFN